MRDTWLRAKMKWFVSRNEVTKYRKRDCSSFWIISKKWGIKFVHYFAEMISGEASTVGNPRRVLSKQTINLCCLHVITFWKRSRRHGHHAKCKQNKGNSLHDETWRAADCKMMNNNLNKKMIDIICINYLYSQRLF